MDIRRSSAPILSFYEDPRFSAPDLARSPTGSGVCVWRPADHGCGYPGRNLLRKRGPESNRVRPATSFLRRVVLADKSYATTRSGIFLGHSSATNPPSETFFGARDKNLTLKSVSSLVER